LESKAGKVDVCYDELTILILRTDILKATYHTAYNKAKKHFEWDGSLGTTAEAGCFEIVTGNDFTSDDNLLIGMAMDDPSGETIPIPVACVSSFLHDTPISINHN
jgi:hypothetical protein